MFESNEARYSENKPREISFAPNYDFLNKEIDTRHGLTKKIVSVFERHWSRNLPLVHFTNDLTNYGPGTKITSTGFVDSIKNNGLNKLSNVGFIPPEKMLHEISERFKNKKFVDLNIITQEDAKASPLKFLESIDRIRKEFIHHGLRTNKNKVSGRISVPAVFIIDNTTRIQSGDDRPIHAQVNEKISPERNIGVFRFDPQDMIQSYMNGLYEQERRAKEIFKEKVPFRKDLSGDDKKIRNDFLKQFLSKLGTFRLKELKALYDYTADKNIKIKIALAAHDLVDIYIISAENYDELFNSLDQTTKNFLIERRKNLLRA